MTLYEEMLKGNITKAEILEELDIAACTYYRYRKQWIEEEKNN